MQEQSRPIATGTFPMFPILKPTLLLLGMLTCVVFRFQPNIVWQYENTSCMYIGQCRPHNGEDKIIEHKRVDIYVQKIIKTKVLK
jgi:hypothetical protein